MLNDPAYLAEADALERLGETKAQTQRRWVVTGLLTPRDLVLVRQYRLAQLESVLELKRHYITSADLARRQEVIRTHFNNQARLGLATPSRIGVSSRSIFVFPNSGTDKSKI